jgi:hypothetical protein
MKGLNHMHFKASSSFFVIFCLFVIARAEQVDSIQNLNSNKSTTILTYTPRINCDFNLLTKATRTARNTSIFGSSLFITGLGLELLPVFIPDGNPNKRSLSAISILSGSLMLFCSPIISCMGADQSYYAMSKCYNIPNHNGWKYFITSLWLTGVDLTIVLLGSKLYEYTNSNLIGTLTVIGGIGFTISADVYYMRSIIHPLRFSINANSIANTK